MRNGSPNVRNAALLRPSFVLSREIGQWCDLIQHRIGPIDQHANVVNRRHKSLQQGKIKI